MIDALKARHSVFADCWKNEFGLRLQRIDSDICAEVQLRMRASGEPVLSVHDGYLAEEMDEHTPQGIMDDVLSETVGKLEATAGAGQPHDNKTCLKNVLTSGGRDRDDGCTAKLIGVLPSSAQHAQFPLMGSISPTDYHPQGDVLHN